MAGRRRWIKWIPSGVVVLAVAAMLLMAGYLYLPTLASDLISNALLRRLGLSDVEARISSIGFYCATAGPVVFGSADRPALSIGTVTLTYAPAGLRHKKIRRVVVRDVVINAMLGPEGVTFPGVVLDAVGSHAASGAAKAADHGSPPHIGVETLLVRSGLLQLNQAGHGFRIPFEMDLSSRGEGLSTVDGRLRLFPRDQRLTLLVRADLTGRSAQLSFDGPAIALEAFADLVHQIPGLDLGGKADIAGRAEVHWAPLAFTDVNAQLKWYGGRFAYGDLRLAPTDAGGAAVFTATSADAATWQLSTMGLSLSQPVPLRLRELSTTLTRSEFGVRLSGNAQVTVQPGVVGSPQVRLADLLPLSLGFEVAQTTAGRWTARCGTADAQAGGATGPIHLRAGAVIVEALAPGVTLTATGDEQGGQAQWALSMGATQATAGKTVVHLPTLNGTGTVQFFLNEGSPQLQADATIRLPRAALNGQGLSANLAALDLTARFSRKSDGASGMDAHLRVTDGQFVHAASGVHLSRLQLDLPLAANPGATAAPGHFSIGRIAQGKRLLGSLKGRILLNKEAYEVDATLASAWLPRLTATLQGHVSAAADHFGDAAFTVKVPTYVLPTDTDLGRLIPAAAGTIVSGRLSASAQALITGREMTGSLDVAVSDGGLSIEARKIAIAGIDAALHFSELPGIRSAPAQKIRFSRAAIGAIEVDGGSFDFQLESADTLLVEKGRLSWCDGKVDTGSLRITAGRQDYAVSLYCQRLGLSRLLEQLGAVHAKGTGTLNGRIPLAYKEGKIHVDDGFLFSTPGEGGHLQITGAEALTRGIPTGTPQFAQVELAREALKDYTYDWAKLGLTSEGDDFIMRLQFDGKPTYPLPFVYQKEIGSFVRVAAGEQGSVFQGIGLDVNLRLPLNQLLQYKEIVNMIQ